MILPAQQRPVITAGAYASGDAVGGLLEFNLSVNKHNGGIIVTAALIDLAKQNVTMDLVLFTKTFAAIADNAAFDPVDADLDNYLATLTFNTYTSFVDSSVASAKQVGLMFHSLDPLGKLYGQLVCRGVYTGATTADILVKLWSIPA